MLSFTAEYSDGTTGSVIPSSYTPASFGDTAGTQTVTFSFEGTDITVDVDYTVSEPVPVTLESLSVTGSLTNAQYLTDAPDLTGLTLKAVYSDASERTLSASDVTVSPAVYTYSASLANAVVPTTQDLTISYTEDNVTVTSGVDDVVVHGKTEYTLPLNQAGSVYYDGFDMVGENVSYGGPSNLFVDSQTFQVGDFFNTVFDEDAYDNDTVIDGQKFMSYLTDYGVDAPEWGAIWTTGRIQSVKAAITGEGTAASGGTAVIVIAPLVNAITAATGYKKSDLDLTQAHIYRLNLTV